MNQAAELARIKSMDEWVTTTEAALRLKRSGRWLAKLCEQGRVKGCRKVGNQWMIPAGAKIERVKLGAPFLTPLEIPRAKGGKR